MFWYCTVLCVAFICNTNVSSTMGEVCVYSGPCDLFENADVLWIMNENYWHVKGVVKPIFLIIAVNFKEMSCGTLWIQYGITDTARMKDPMLFTMHIFLPCVIRISFQVHVSTHKNRGRQVLNVRSRYCCRQRMFH